MTNDNKQYNFMIFKADDNTSDENDLYQERIKEFSKQIAQGYHKGKKVLVITGSGISNSVPGMSALMDKLCEFIDNYNSSTDVKYWEQSEVFKTIYSDYLNKSDSESHQMQSRLLTYVQNAYMGKGKYVQDGDLEPLSRVWGQLVVWLLQGDRKKYEGIIKAQPSANHCAIKEMYKEMNAISITTNFDNLLQKVFGDDDNFYPILDNESFDRYFLSKDDDKSYIEIQSRGDAFWLECTGSRNKICPNKHRQCFVPGKTVRNKAGKIICNLCKSEAKIYFAFPGMKEKDAEMSLVINGVWKYLANTISSVVVTGNSMDYDPVLVEFLRELIQKRKVPVLYVSRLKRDKEGKVNRSYEEVYKKEATRFLFSNVVNNINIWARCKNTEEILQDIFECFKNEKEQTEKQKQFFSEKDIARIRNYFYLSSNNIFKSFSEVETNLKEAKDVCSEALELDEVEKMRHFSQLGLKTYWLRGQDNIYQDHNRYKHSVGVMLIASYLYLMVSDKPSKEELYFLQLAALFHDLGHLPFSHLLEEVFEEFGWIPAGESASFNHEQHTKRLIERVYLENDDLRNIMSNIGYSVSDLQQLINGEFGKGYLDAFINSPVDCDKIEYLFSDAIFMKRGTEEDFDLFIKDYVKNLSINSNNFLLIEKNSTKSFLKLIRMRGEMYDQVYLRSGLRYLEACCKLIIRTFISYICTEKKVFSAVEDRSRFEEYYNLSDAKIEQVIRFMESCLDKISKMEVCELFVLKEMVERINENNTISSVMKETINRCMNLIENTKGNEGILKIEEENIITYEITNKNFDKSMLKQLLKNVYLRFPGVILIDYVESKSSFSFGKRENRKRRSDGTKSATENILIKDIRQVKGMQSQDFECLGNATKTVDDELHYSGHSYINIYRISDNSFYYMQAEDYIIHELKKEGIIDED